MIENWEVFENVKDKSDKSDGLEGVVAESVAPKWIVLWRLRRVSFSMSRRCVFYFLFVVLPFVYGWEQFVCFTDFAKVEMGFENTEKKNAELYRQRGRGRKS